MADESVLYQDKFDRLMTYDFAGRVKEAKSGIEAHGQTESDLMKLPYRQSYVFDAFGNVTGRESTLWNNTDFDWDFSYTMVNNRLSGHAYDNDGRHTVDYSNYTTTFSYDATGLLIGTARAYQGYETLLSRE